jgi:hypothetical protein
MCGSGGGRKLVIPEMFYPLGSSLSYVGEETTETKAKKVFSHNRWNGLLSKAVATSVTAGDG